MKRQPVREGQLAYGGLTCAPHGYQRTMFGTRLDESGGHFGVCLAKTRLIAGVLNAQQEHRRQGSLGPHNGESSRPHKDNSREKPS
jgi:hypothetical protein